MPSARYLGDEARSQIPWLTQTHSSRSLSALLINLQVTKALRTLRHILFKCTGNVHLPTSVHCPPRRHADTPTRRHADTPTRRHADTPTRRHALNAPARSVNPGLLPRLSLLRECCRSH